MKHLGIVLITGAAMLLVGMGVSNVTALLWPSIQSEYQNPALFRSWQDPLMSLIGSSLS